MLQVLVRVFELPLEPFDNLARGLIKVLDRFTLIYVTFGLHYLHM